MRTFNTAKTLSLALLSTLVVTSTSASHSFAASPVSTKIVLTPSMVARDLPSNEGDPTLLVDEQALAGDPAKGTGGKPKTNWGAQWAAKKMTAKINLGKKYVITQVYLYDANGGLTATDGTYQVIANTASGDQTLVSDLLSDYLAWKKFDVNTTTQTVTVVTPTGYIGMPEIVLYGYDPATVPAPTPSASPSPTPSATPGVSVKLSIDPSMISRLSPTNEGDPSLLVDEQALAGDPAKGTGGKPTTNWAAQFAAKKMTAKLDLGRNYVITQVYLYDANGGLTEAEGRYQVIANTASGDQTVVSDLLSDYLAWKRFDTNVTTRTLTISTPTGYIGMREIVLYGYDASSAPTQNQAPAVASIADSVTTEGLTSTIALSATDVEGDKITFSLRSASLSFLQLYDNGNGTGSLALTPLSGSAGTYPITIRATDSQGAYSEKSFSLQVKALVVTPPPTTPPVSTLGGKQTAIPTGLIAGSTWQTHLGYQEYLPEGYNPADSTRYPIVFFFHGLGEIGNGSVADLAKLIGPNSPPGMLARGQLQPLLPAKAIVLSPQTPMTLWVASHAGNFMRWALGVYGAKVDMKRIYITGLSLGGGGVWDPINDPSYTDLRALVAGIVPICGFATGADYRALRGVPTWAHHSRNDGTVAYDYTRMKMQQLAMDVNPETNRPTTGTNTGYFDSNTQQWVWAAGIKAPVNAASGKFQNLIFTVLPGSGHDAWTQAYQNAEVWKWLFSQSR